MNTDERSGLVGRAAELAVFELTLAELALGLGSAILVEGEPGIGKSALMEALAAAADVAGIPLQRTTCDDLGRELPFGVMTELLGAKALYPDLPGGTRVGWSVPMLNGDPTAAVTERLLREVDRLCAAGPLVLVVDDLQWADDVSLLMWRRLVRLSSNLPLLAVGTARPVPTSEGLDGLRRDVRSRGGRLLTLAPLNVDEVRCLVRRWAGGMPGPRLTGRIDAATGNPLYVRELLDALDRSGALSVADGVVEIGDGGDAGSRAAFSLTTAIMDRLGFLSPGCQAALRTAALLGPDFLAAELGAILDQGPGAVVDLLQEAFAAGVLESVGARARFRHGLIKQALHEATPSAVRAVLLQHAAQWLIGAGAAAERVAQMLSAGLDTVNGWELDWLVEHLDVLVGVMPVVAADLVENALRHVPLSDPRIAVLEDHLAAAAVQLHRLGPAERITRRILANAVGTPRYGRAVWTLGFVLMQSHRQDEALVLINEARIQCAKDPVWSARLAAHEALAKLHSARFAEAREAAMSALDLAKPQGDAMACGYALYTAATCSLVQGEMQTAADMYTEGLAIVGLDSRLTDLRVSMMSNYAAALEGLDRFQEAEKTLRQAVVLAEPSGTPRLTILRVHTAAVAFVQGHWDEVIAEYESLDGDSFFKNQPLERQVMHGLMARVALHRDDLGSSAAHLAYYGAGQHPPEEAALPNIVFTFAQALAAERATQPDEALRILAEALEAEQGELPNREIVFPFVMRLALQTGDRSLALRARAVCAEDAARIQDPHSAAYEQWCDGLAQSDPSLLLQAAEYFRAAGRPIQLGNVLEDAAVLEAQADRYEDARRTRQEAIAVYTELNALWDARRAAARLRAAGLQSGVRGPRRRPSTGWDALTPTERQVAELVARGDSNTVIAERFVLSRRTVEVHVSHILAKLQVRSRREVAALVTD